MRNLLSNISDTIYSYFINNHTYKYNVSVTLWGVCVCVRENVCAHAGVGRSETNFQVLAFSCGGSWGSD